MLYHDQNDETLVMLTLAGEQRAYEVLVLRYQNAVISAAASVTHSRFMAEDAAQDAFVTAWMKLNTLVEANKFGAWVCRIAKNCALNTVMRMRSFISLDDVDNIDTYADTNSNPAELYAIAEGKRELHGVIGKMPAKVKEIISLHYFEGLSIADIAERMNLAEGTVKWQLHDGRKRIRKELCAMNEKYNDTLTERVMKKVEELKLWQVKNDKSGFEKIYNEVLREVEELPECREKHHALADVLMRGWWWLPGDKNDALFARIKEAALVGKNEDVMAFIVAREDSKVYGSACISFIREKQIPMLEKAGFTKVLGREWFWLGYNLLREKKTDEGLAAYAKAEEILTDSDAYRALIPCAKRMAETLDVRYKDTAKERYRICGTAEEYRVIDGGVRYWSKESFGEGYLGSMDWLSTQIFRNASACDGLFFADVAVGEAFTGSDGTKLTYVSNAESVETPAGKFENCALWEVRRWTDTQKTVCRTYYKNGVGIVRQENTTDGATNVRTLCAYSIAGGNGLLPFARGNSWEYKEESAKNTVVSELKFEVAFADGKRTILSSFSNTERLGYDESSWLDTVQEIANEYNYRDKKDNCHIRDVYNAIERAEKLAKTPMEKAHTKAAASVARRILSTDSEFNPERTATGHWNFFCREYIRKKADALYLTDYNPRWSFEWKCMGGMGIAEDPVLYNDILGILQDAANCLWSEEWRVGASPIIEYTKWDRTVKTKITCEDGGTVTTKAGTFENCFKLCLDIGGMEAGWSYRGGKKVYYFAEGIGIIRTENEYCDGAKTAVYELTSFEGTGEGFMPLADGLFRRYDAIGLTDGFVGSVEYQYVADEDGDIVVFADQTGIRELPPPITMYSAIQDELDEEDLWNEGKRDESRLRHDINNFKLLLHMLGRYNRSLAKPHRATEIGKYHIRTVELLAEGGDIPRAWLGRYWRSHFYVACTLFGEKKKEEGYEYLEKAFELYPAWAEIPDGEALEVGNEHIFGGIKVIKGKGLIELPDGTREPYDYEYLLNPKAEHMYYGMTAPRGWEWFNSVRGEDRFKEYIEKAKELMEKED